MKLTKMLFGIQTKGSQLSFIFFLPSLPSIINNQIIMRQINFYKRLFLINYIYISSMNPIAFDAKKDSQLLQLMKEEGEATTILQKILFSSQQDFPQKLIMVQDIPKNMLSYRLTDRIKQLCILKLFNKLDSWTDWKVLGSDLIIQRLTTLIALLCGNDHRKEFTVIELIIGKTKSPQIIFPFLQKKFVDEHLPISQINSSSWTLIKELLANSYKVLKDGSLDNELSLKYPFQPMNEVQTQVTLAKIIKIYSHAFIEDDLSEFDIEALFAEFALRENQGLLRELTSLRHSKSQELISKVLQWKVERSQETFLHKTQATVNPRFITLQLLNQVLQKSSTGHNCLHLEMTIQEQKHAFFRYNIFQLSDQAFANMLPHKLLKKDDEIIYKEQCQFFLQRFKQILGILQKIANGWKFFIFNIQEGRVTPRQCSGQQISRIIQICLFIWSNTFKMMTLLDNSSVWVEFGLYHKFHEAEQCKVPRMIKNIQLILNLTEVPSYKMLNHLLYIIRYLESLYSNNYDQIFQNKDLSSTFATKIRKRFQASLGKEPVPSEVIWMLFQKIKVFKEQSLSIDDLPLNSPQVFQLIFEYAFRKGHYDYFSSEGPYFFVFGMFKDDQASLSLFDDLMEHYPQFEAFITQKCQQLLSQIELKDSLVFTNYNKEKIYLLVQLFNKTTFYLSQSLTQKLKMIFAVRADIFDDMGDYKLSALLKRVKLSYSQEEKGIVVSLMNILKNEELYQVNPQELIDSFWTDNQLLLQLKSKLQYWSLLLVEANRVYNPELCDTYRQLIMLLKKTEFCFREKIVQYVSSLEETKIQKLVYTYTLITDSLYSIIIGKRVEKFGQRIRDALAKSNKTIISNFFNESNPFLKQIQCNSNDPSKVRSFCKFLTKMLDNVSGSYKKVSFGPIFYFKHKSLFLTIIKSLYLKYEPKDNNNDWSDDCNDPSVQSELISKVLQFKLEQKNPMEAYNQLLEKYPFRNIQELIKSSMNINTSSETVVVNNKEYWGSSNIMRIQKSILVDFLKSQQAQFKVENIKFYSFVVKQIIDNIQSLIRYENDNPNEQEPSNIPAPQQSLTILSSDKCNKVFSDALVSFIKKILQHHSHPDIRQNAKDLIDHLLNAITDKKILQKERESLFILMIKKVQSLLSEQQPKCPQYQIEMEWICLFLKSMNDISINKYLSSKFVIKLVVFLKKIIPKENECSKSLELSLPLLSRLIPTQSFTQLPTVTNYTINILNIIVKIVPIVIYRESSFFESVVFKLASSSNPQILKYANHLMEQISLGSTAYILCQSMQKYEEKVSIEADIKGYFFRIWQESSCREGEIETTLHDLVYRFQQKYKDRIIKFRDSIIQYGYKQTKKLNDKERVYIKYIHKDKFQYSRSINEDFLKYKPSLFIRHQIKQFTSKIAQSLEDNQDMLDKLRLLIFYSPILMPYILFHSLVVNQKPQTLIDLIIRAAVNNTIDAAKQFVAFSCLDHSSIVKGKQQVFFLSHYVCYRVVQILQQSQFTINTLMFILFLCRLKIFSKLCNAKILKDKKSLRDKIQEFFIASRKEFVYDNDVNIVCPIILTILYRYDYIGRIKNSTKENLKEKSDTYKLVQSCLIPFQPVFTTINKDQTIDEQQLNLIDQKTIISQYEAIASTLQLITNQTTATTFNELELDQISLQSEFQMEEEFLPLIGFEHIQKVYESTSNVLDSNLSYDFQEVCRYVQKWYKNDPTRDSNDYKSNKLFLEQIDLESLEQEQSKNEKKNNLQPSRFAVQDFSPLATIESNESKDEEDDQKYLKAFKEIKEATSINNINVQVPLENKQFQGQELHLTQEMSGIINRINHNLTLLNRSAFDVSECKGKNEENGLEILRVKELQTEFDIRESTMNESDFETYCLQNVFRLERLPSDRRNKVKLIEAQMLQAYMQRTMSEDSIDYIIDTIDENYQHLSRLERAKSKNQQIIQLSTQHKQKKYLSASQLPLQAFPIISSDFLFEIALCFYNQTQIINMESLIPFLENRSNQSKLINTLIFILRDPFGNEVFPKGIHHYSEKTKMSVEEEVKEIRSKIIRFISSFNSYSFIKDPRYLLQKTDYECLKTIKLQPNSLFGDFFPKDQHIPKIQILYFMLDTDLDRKYKIQMFQGVQEVPDCLLPKIVTFFTQLNIYLEERTTSENNKGNYLYQYIEMRKDYKSEQNLIGIFKNKKLKQQIRQLYPVTDIPILNPFMFYLFFDSDIYSIEQIKAVHNSILKRGRKKSPDIFFCNQILRFYTDQELKQTAWIIQHAEMYCTVYQFFCNELNVLKKIAKQPFYRLMKCPQLLHLRMKSQILKLQVKELEQRNNFTMEGQIKARRERGIFESAFQELRYKPDPFWLYDFDVKFIGMDGKLQSGYGGGVGKEWYTLVTKGMVNLNYGLFMKTSKNYYYFNRQSWINPRHLQFFEFIGKIFGMSIVRPKHFIGPSFSIIIYKMILGQKVQFADIIEQFDEGEVLKNIQKMREYTDNSLFCQTFVYEDKRLIADTDLRTSKTTNQSHKKQYLLNETQYMQGEVQTQEGEANAKMLKVLKVGESIELVPGGANIPVTKQNLQEFIRLTKQKIYDIIVSQVAKQASAFIEGFKKVISVRYLKKFTPQELRQLAEGSDKISVEQIKNSVTISVNDCKKCLELFWVVLEELAPQEKIHFMHHWTGTPKIPAGGLKEMNLQIRQRCDERRIFAHTCFNRIYLPFLQTKQEVNEAVKTAIASVKQGLSIIED